MSPTAWRHRRFGGPHGVHTPLGVIFAAADLVLLITLLFLVLPGFHAGPRLAVDLPAAEAAQLPDALQAVTLGIDRQGRYTVDGRPVAEAEVAAAMRPRLAVLRRPAIIVSADRGTPWEDIVQALDLARSLGVDQVELSVEAAGERARPQPAR